MRCNHVLGSPALVACIAACSALLTTGCFGPVKNPASRRAVQEKAARERAEDESRNTSTARAPINDAGDGPLAELVVKGEVIRADDVWSRNRKQLATKRAQMTPEEFNRYVQRESILLINDRLGEVLLYQAATLRMPENVAGRVDSYVDAEIRKIVSTKHDGIQRRYEKALAEEGRTLDDVREELRRQMTISAYLDQEFRPKIGEPTRAELLATFEENKQKWQRPSRRKMSLIDLRVLEFLPDGVTEPTREQMKAARAEAKTVAGDIVESLRVGTSFPELARRWSHGLHADEGGAWGWVERGTLRERFTPAVDALYSLSENEVAGPIETPDGFFVVRCDEIDPGFDADFESIQPQLLEEYQRGAYARMVSEHVAELREKCAIDIHTLERFHMAVVQAALAYHPGGAQP